MALSVAKLGPTTGQSIDGNCCFIFTTIGGCHLDFLSSKYLDLSLIPSRLGVLNIKMQGNIQPTIMFVWHNSSHFRFL